MSSCLSSHSFVVLSLSSWQWLFLVGFFSLFACHGFDLDLVSWICLYLLDLFAWNFWTDILVLIPACLQLWVCFPYNKVLWTDPTWAFCICISGWILYSVYCFWHMHDTVKFKNDVSGLFLFCSLHYPNVYNRVSDKSASHIKWNYDKSISQSFFSIFWTYTKNVTKRTHQFLFEHMEDACGPKAQRPDWQWCNE